MTDITDVSQALGDFMLKGYVLTDQSCPTPGCAIPILRTPSRISPVLTFCVQCSKDKNQAQNPTRRTGNEETAASASNSSSSHHSPSSTPPTEFSEAANSFVFELPPETDEIRRRREQSDRASSEIGKKLLKGWTMLGEECPNDGCYGVPLVRPPNVGGTADLRKECVICRSSFMTDVDWSGREILVPYVVKTDHSNAKSQSTSGAKMREPSLQGTPQKRPKLSSSLDLHPAGHRTTPDVTSNQEVIRIGASLHNHSQPSATLCKSGLDDTLSETSDALQASLEALSSSLRTLSSESQLDPYAIGTTADAIGKVTQALSQVRQL